MTDYNSTLTFKEYFIEENIFIRNENVSTGKFDIEFDLNSSIGIHEDDKTKSRLTLTCEIFDENFIENDKPFYIKTSIVGYFECEDMDIEGFEFNGMAILFPYLRSYISSVTAQAGISPVTLPAINVYKFFKKND